MKRKPCGRMIVTTGLSVPCSYERAPGKQQCVWHWLLKQPPHVQKTHAERRLKSAQEFTDIHVARVSKDRWPDGERWCSGCQSFVPLFYCTGSRCKACASSAAHGRRVEETFGITAEQYDELFRKQGGRCAICRNKPRTMRLAVDHDHQSGEVRGLLCKRCNHDLLGGGHDDVLVLWRAIAYLVDPPASRRGLSAPQIFGDVLRRLGEVAMRKPKVEEKPPPF